MEERRKNSVPAVEVPKRMLVDVDQPQWVCYECGVKHGFFSPGLATWHPDTCGVCDQQKTVTEPRDFGYLAKGWKEKRDGN